MRTPGPPGMGDPDPHWIDEGTSALTRMPSPAERLGAPRIGWSGDDALARMGRVRHAMRDAGPMALRLLGERLAGIDLADIGRSLIAACEDIALYYGGALAGGAALGGAIGFLAGGVGALPGALLGAAAGSQVGLWILTLLGLESLAEFFFEGLPSILRTYREGFNLAWEEERGHFQASRRIAEGHVAVMMLLLSAIVAYLLRGRGDMQTLAAQVRGGRLGEPFANWLLRNEDRLREHPNLRPRGQRPSSAGGGREPPPPPKPPTRRAEGEPAGPRRMARQDVRCFKANGLPHEKVPEFDRQLSGQEKGLNDLTVDEYLKGRAAFANERVKRDAGLAARARKGYGEELVKELTQNLRQDGLSRNAAKAKAAEIAKDKMDTLAALHNPDMVAGGKDAISGFGDRNVNSRIGAQWNSGKNSRLVDLDFAARAVPEGDRAATKINAKLKRCQ